MLNLTINQHNVMIILPVKIFKYISPFANLIKGSDEMQGNGAITITIIVIVAIVTAFFVGAKTGNGRTGCFTGCGSLILIIIIIKFCQAALTAIFF